MPPRLRPQLRITLVDGIYSSKLVSFGTIRVEQGTLHCAEAARSLHHDCHLHPFVADLRIGHQGPCGTPLRTERCALASFRKKKEEWVQAIFGIDGSKANKSIDEPKKLLTAAIRASRRKVFGHHPDSGSDESSNEDQPIMKEWRSSKRCTTLKITVLEHTLLAINSLRPIALRCDENTISFLKAVAVPLITKARSQSDTVPVTEPPAPFNFSGKAPFTFPGRVVWMPTTNSYELKLSGKGATQLDKRSTTTDLEGKPLQVPPDLRGCAFQEARQRICHLACLAWNQRDRSTRPRFFPGEGRDREAEGTAE